MKTARFTLLFLLLAGVAGAGTYAKVVRHTTSRSAEHVLTVLMADDQTCHSGCKYEAPDLKQRIRLTHKSTEKSWYTWTWISTTLKDTKFFTHVTRLDKPDGTILLVQRLVGKDEAGLRAELEKASGKSSDGAFDSGKTVFVVRKQEDGKTKIVQDITLVASGMIDMFAGAIRDGIDAGTAANIRNIEK